MRKYSYLIIFALLVNFIFSEEAKALKAATIDKMFVFNNFSMVQDSLNTIQNSKERVQRLITTADKELQQMEESNAKASEIESRQKEIQRILDQEVISLQNEQVDLRNAVEKHFRDQMDKLAIDRNYDLIIDKAFIVDKSASMPDLTDEFLKILEKSVK